jgi:hypothetical protein
VIAFFYTIMIACPSVCQPEMRYDVPQFDTRAQCHAALSDGEYCQRFSIDMAAIRRGEVPSYVPVVQGEAK